MGDGAVGDDQGPVRRRFSLAALWPSVPMPLVMLLAALALGVAGGMDSGALIHAVNAGFGGSLGEYALILIPSFVLAAALSRSNAAAGSGRLATLLAPLAGAGMVCPDTAYVALSPMAGARKLSVLFGAYAGFKLLVPAGPAIVATAFGGFSHQLAIAAVPVFLVAWGVGLLYARAHEGGSEGATPLGARRRKGRVPLPLAVVFLLLAAGGAVQGLGHGSASLPPVLDLLLTPKGALLAAAVVALVPLAPEERASALDSGLRRTAPLLLTIGAANALGAMLVATVPVAAWAGALVSTGLVLPALFMFTASFKVVKGSSMATFAGTSGIVAALLPSLQVSPEAAALAMCAGAFVTITPNDSLFWLVRQDAFAGRSDAAALRTLMVGPALQGAAALLAVCALSFAGLI